jgi:hypothetical protein
MEQAIRFTGGARIGWANATWPLVKFTASAAGLKISGILGTYEFLPRDVVSIERYGSIPLFSSGIRIFHARSDYPPKIIVWCARPEALIQDIHRTGFLPIAPASSQTRWHGIPLRWSAIVFFVVAWNGLFLIDDSVTRLLKLRAGLLSLVPLLLTFLVCWRLKTSPELQKMVLSEGHSVGEIRAYLNLLEAVSGVLLVVFAVLTAAGLLH